METKKKYIKLNKLFMYKIFFIEFLMFMYLIFYEFYHSKNKKKQDNNNSKIFDIIKRSFFNMIYEKLKINTTYINAIYMIGFKNFGNFLISLNNAIIFCELFKCKKIIIEYSDNIFIKNKILCPKNNLTIEPNYNINFANGNIIFLNVNYFYYIFNFKFLGQVNRFDLFRNEIISNLPKTNVHPKDLFIYIRGGDIFSRLNQSNPSYPQPPFCFYETILNKFKFKEISIISEDILNPVTPKLLNKYPYINPLSSIKIMHFLYPTFLFSIHDSSKKFIILSFKNIKLFIIL